MKNKQELIEENEKLLKELNDLKGVIWGVMKSKDSKLVELEMLAKEYEKVINLLSGRLMALYSGDAVRELPETEELK